MGRFFRTLAAFAVCASPVLADGPRTIIVMDGSGSMWGQIDGRAKLEIARDTVADVLGQLSADQSIGLMAYGHRRKGDCNDIELMVAPASGTAADIVNRVNTMRFLGKTPLSEAVRQAAEALNYGEEAANVVLVTDGLETCEADPCALGRELEAAGLDFTAHVIGFGLTREEGTQVACLAENTGGRYIDARNASDLVDALTDTIAATALQPDPVPETPTAPLATAGLVAVDEAPLGSMVDVAWTVSDPDPFDTITIGRLGDDSYIYYVYASGNPVGIQMPGEVGSYELRYVSKDNFIVHRRPITVTEAPLALNAPDQVIAGGIIPVQWQGPDAQYDNIRMRLPGDESYISYEYVSGQNPVLLTAPAEPGTYELVYMLNDANPIITRLVDVLPVGSTVAPVPANLSAPEQTEAGEEFMVGWSGPGSSRDYIYLRLSGDSGYISYGSIADGNPVLMVAPSEPGQYELAYVMGDVEVLTTRSIDVVEVVAEEVIPPALTAPALIAVTLEAEGAADLFAVQWSAVPTEDNTLAREFAPEAIAMTDYQMEPVTIEVFAGGYDVHGDAGDQVFAGRIDVVPGGATKFIIPYDTALSPAGEDPAPAMPESGDPLAIKINGQYNLNTQWQATPASGQDSLVLGTDFQMGGWDTALDPGRWLIEGFAEGGKGHLYAAVVEVGHDSPREMTLPRTAGVSQTPVNLPTGDPAKAHCVGDVACYHTDVEGGVSYLLLPEWASAPAFFYETAGGVVADQPTVTFYTGVPFAVVAVLNPRQWDALLGPCNDTPLGPLCAVSDVDPAGVALLLASITAPMPEAVAPAARPLSDGTAMTVDTPVDLPAGLDPAEWFAPGFLEKE
ncbi:VWA domain-containing protein [Puniceibacterium antarcticum]|uniref:VWA domain-containing protein n=1 Tax=Puniceibacterium antarcticum TaxID=1206336 RepID=UPI001C5575DA|nr:VWA domain-containing protein [Puniceibacterium antarcticum]